MIRFDTFRFDYDTKNVIVFSRAVVVLLVRHALLLTDGTICSCRLRVAFLSSRTAVVAGYTACCQHGNGN